LRKAPAGRALTPAREKRPEVSWVNVGPGMVRTPRHPRIECHAERATRTATMSRSTAVFLAALGSLLLAVVLGACGSSGGSAGRSTSAAGKDGKVSYAAPSVATPPKAAAPLQLRNSLGQRVDLRSYRGKAVLVTFIYTHCPDVCPLIVGNLHNAQANLGAKAKDLRIVAVSTDPRGDTPKTVARFLRQHDMTGRMQYLLGSRRQLGRVWKAWNIVARPEKADPELVEHSALIYGISGSGNVTTLYPANFKPAWIVHDVPLLATH
jgi:protein SCO1/2